MGEATKTTLGDLAKAGHLEFGDGYRTKRAEHGKPGIPILRVAEVLDGKILPALEDYVSDAYRDSMGQKISQPGDVVLTTKGTVGRVAIMPSNSPEFVYSPQLCYFRLRPGSPLLARYLYYWFKSEQFWSQARSRKSQTDMADYLNLADIRSLEISLPELREQQAVTSVLGALDDKIAVNERIATTVDRLAEAEYVRSTGKATETVLLGDLLDLKYGKALPATSRSPGDVPVYGSGGIVGMHNQHLVDGPGIVVGRKGTVGAVHWSQQKFFPIDTTFYVEVRRPDVPMEFLFFMLRKLGLDSMNSDSAVPGLNRANALALKTHLPQQDELARFADKIRPLFELKHSLSVQSNCLKELRDTLLPKLMSGELRVRDAEKAVEEAL